MARPLAIPLDATRVERPHDLHAVQVAERERSLLGVLWEDARTARRLDPAANSLAEVFLAYPGVHALWAYRIAHHLWRRGARLSARAISAFAQASTGVDIHPAARIGRRVFIDHATGVVIGQTARVGDDVVIYHGVTLGGVSMRRGKRHPTVGSHVMIGAGAKVLGAIHVGDGAKIGANAVVTRDVPAGSIAVGIPARILPPTSSEDASVLRDPTLFI